MSRHTVLFVTPVTPAEAGNGLAMRAGVWLEGLARTYDVRVLVAPVFGRVAAPGALVRRCASSCETLDLGTPTAADRPLIARRATATAAQTVAATATGCAAVHVMRVYLAPLLDVLLDADRRPKLVLDVDDLESSLARDSDPAGNEEPRRYRRLEDEYLPRLDAVTVTTLQDRRVLELRHPGLRVACIPNAVRIPRHADPTGAAASGLLLVGNLSYGPNVEGAEWFVQRVLPLFDDPPRVNLVGSGPTPRVLALADHPTVRVVANVPAVGPWYGEARVALAPVLRGGGTRIKVIEALAHRRPVVATPVGARGLDPGLIGDPDGDAPILVAESPAAFAHGCARLLADVQLARRLGDAGCAGVEATASLDRVASTIDVLMREIIGADVPSL